MICAAQPKFLSYSKTEKKKLAWIGETRKAYESLFFVGKPLEERLLGTDRRRLCNKKLLKYVQRKFVVRI
jgi:hypothetical protein